jgi:hypothetical protein
MWLAMLPATPHRAYRGRIEILEFGALAKSAAKGQMLAREYRLLIR